MTVTCPHCGIAFDAYGAPAHVASCLQRPGAIDLARRLLEATARTAHEPTVVGSPPPRPVNRRRATGTVDPRTARLPRP